MEVAKDLEEPRPGSCNEGLKRNNKKTGKNIPSRELTYPTWGKGKSSSKCHFWGDMLVPWRVLVCPWKLVTIVSKLVYNLLKFLYMSYLYWGGYNPVAKYHGHPSTGDTVDGSEIRRSPVERYLRIVYPNIIYRVLYIYIIKPTVDGRNPKTTTGNV